MTSPPGIETERIPAVVDWAIARCTCGWSRLESGRATAQTTARAHRNDPAGGPPSQNIPIPTYTTTTIERPTHADR